LGPLARAIIVHDGAVARARELFPDVMCGMTQQLFTLDFDGKLLARLKLLDEDLAPRSIPTGQTMLLDNQSQVAALMTLWPPAAMLICGYTLDAMGVEIDEVLLVLRHENRLIWQHDLRTPIEMIDFLADTDIGEGNAEAQ
jgi:hypothetical protein